MFTFKSFVRSWDHFFFSEKPVEGIAVFRIVWMSLIFSYFLLDLANIDDFYGPHSLISLSTVKSQFPFLHANLFHLFHPSYEVTYAIVSLYGIALLSSILGLYTRSSLFLALICMTSLHQRNIWLLSSSEVLMRSVTLLLVLSPSGNALSLDALMGKYFPKMRKPRIAPVWVLRLIQIQVSVVYTWTVWHKIKGETWFDGTAVYYATRLEAMTNFTIPYLMDSLIFLKISTWGTLIVELALGILVWFEEFRKPVIIIGILFHLGIEYLMSIPFFELYMIALLINFFTPEEFKLFIERVKLVISRGIQGSTLGEQAKSRILAIVGAV